MQQHIIDAVRAHLPVNKTVIQRSVAQKQACDDEKRHNGEIDAVERHAAAEVGGDGYYHLAEGEDDVEHGALAQMRKIHGHQGVFPPGDEHGYNAEENRHVWDRNLVKRVYENVNAYEKSLREYDDSLLPKLLQLPGGVFMITHLYNMLDRYVNEYQRPRDRVFIHRSLPPYARAVRHKIQEKHIDEEENVIPNSVSAVDVYIKRGKIPNLYNGESSQNVSQEDACGYETALYILNERVIAPDKIYEDKIVDKLQIFNLFFLALFRHLLDHSLKLLYSMIPLRKNKDKTDIF